MAEPVKTQMTLLESMQDDVKRLRDEVSDGLKQYLQG
jgi:hypothetical protein